MHFVPEGESHSVAWCFVHATRIEDMLSNAVCQQRAQIFAGGDWAGRTGLPVDSFGTGQSTEEAREVRIRDLDAFGEYAEAVYEATATFLDRLSDDDLDREVTLGERGRRR